MSRALAIETVRFLDLKTIIRSWNNGRGSLIADFDDFEVALTFYDEKYAVYGIRCEEAERENAYDDFIDEVKIQLRPVIIGSLLVAVRPIFDDWADRAMNAGIKGLRIKDGQHENQSWIERVIEKIGFPDRLCGPYGCTLIDEDGIKILLEDALLRRMREAPF